MEKYLQNSPCVLRTPPSKGGLFLIYGKNNRRMCPLEETLGVNRDYIFSKNL